MITKTQLKVKRIFDLVLVIIVLPILLLPILILIIVATIDTNKYGVFSQFRVGQHGELFKIYKIRSLREEVHKLGHLDKSVTKFGEFLRRTKLNELPQSFVGPRPDLQGFADKLEGEDRIILIVKPGVTGEATLKYKNEERVLERQKDPKHYNRTIIWVDKVKINKKYVENYSFYLDLTLILKSTLYK